MHGKNMQPHAPSMCFGHTLPYPVWRLRSAPFCLPMQLGTMGDNAWLDEMIALA